MDRRRTLAAIRSMVTFLEGDNLGKILRSSPELVLNISASNVKAIDSLILMIRLRN
jgi:hypothetical protein